MYVYLTRADGKFECGYWNPDGMWHPQQAFDAERDACKEVCWLNGGEDPHDD